MIHDDSTIQYNEDDPKRSVLHTDLPSEGYEPLFLMLVSERELLGNQAWHWLDLDAARELRAELDTFISSVEDS